MPIRNLTKCFSHSITLDVLTHWKVYLENLLIQDPGAEHGDAVGVDGSVVAPQELFGDPLLTVYNDGDRLLLHADGHAVPPGQGHNEKRWEITEARVSQYKCPWELPNHSERLILLWCTSGILTCCNCTLWVYHNYRCQSMMLYKHAKIRTMNTLWASVKPVTWNLIGGNCVLFNYILRKPYQHFYLDHNPSFIQHDTPQRERNSKCSVVRCHSLQKPML